MTEITRMTVPAFLRKARLRCHTNKPMVRQLGMWYRGNSMMKAARSPRKAILLMAMPDRANTIRFNAIRPHETSVAAWPKKTGARKAMTTMRAVQGTNGASMMVSSRARRDSITRAPTMEGTLQPKPRNKGRKLLPCRPIRCMKRSIT